ncbi:hypothetical protein sce4109 [Sorangium cellulosum So ce56]|uniref:Gp5/Type VI secretion system Vgr C-terminal trimerisation domain-containing protein n=1 Tax=Sorangium cellulosum (strain So ce56) TaxID=448385 RepID=A9EVZ6_SORC5|nr:type VI secretion system tip protein TssI/VgrG [Sorangium cellulosum]CAN94272.1 hypothetical protein sce4109 [Sorangium cellulosum So ce56]
MTLARTHTLEIDGAGATFAVLRVRGRERLHEPSRFEVTAAVDGSVELGSLLAQPARLAWALPDGSERAVLGSVDVVESVAQGLRVTIVPKIALLADAVDYQVFVDEDAVSIVEEVLSEHGISVERRLVREAPKRAQCVQCFESDLDFVSRLCAEEGISWFIVAGARDRVVLCDHDGGWEPLPGLGSMPVREPGGFGETEESVTEARVRVARVYDEVTLRDYNCETPLVDQTAAAASGQGGPLQHYAYPGGYADPDAGGDVAVIRLDQLRARRVVLEGKTTSRRLAPGHQVELVDDRRGDVTGTWVVLEVVHDAMDGTHDDRSYIGTFRAFRADASYRTAAPPQPRVGGVETATITGPAGAEIHAERLGRLKLRLRWDRRRPEDDTASALARVVQPPASGGLVFPRVGWENLVAFLHGSADAPWVLGRLYNGEAVPPDGLPGNKVVSAFGTLTSPGGGSRNLIRLDDTAGNEAMAFEASKDWNERTENDKSSKITANDAWTVGASRKLIVGQVLGTTVSGAQSYTVGANRTVNVTSNKTVDAGSETVIVGGLRTFDVGGDHGMSSASLTRLVGGAKVEAAIEHVNRSVKGAETVVVGGTWKTVAGASYNTSVSGLRTETVAGSKSIKSSKLYLKVRGAYSETLASRSTTAGSDREEGFSGALTYQIGGSASVKASEITIKARSKITLKAGGATVTITPSAITIDGDYKSSGESADDGSEEYPG